MTELFAGALIQLVCSTGDFHSTVTVYHISDAMASGDSRPEVNQSRVSFRNQLVVPWNAPMGSIVTLDSPGVVLMSSVYGHVMTTQRRHECCLGGPRTVLRS